MQKSLKPVLAFALVAIFQLCQGAAVAANATGYPIRPIRLVVPQNPGASNDTISRIVAGKMSEFLGQQIVTDNRPGAGGIIAGEIVAHSAPDGYTLYATATSQVIGPQIVKHVPYDPERGFAPISLIAVTQNVLVVNPKLPVRSLKDLVAYTKAHPGKLNMGNGGAGTQSHLAAVLLAHAVGLDVVHIPYKGGGAVVAAVISGESQAMIGPAPTVLGHARAGRLRALASGGAKRSPFTPDLPTLIESGVPGFTSTGWIGLLAPRGTPRPVLDKLHAAVVKAVSDPATVKLIERAGAEPETGTPAQFGKFMSEEWQRFGEAIKLAKLKAD